LYRPPPSEFAGIAKDRPTMQASSEVPLSTASEWEGTERYSILRRVGEGGMGVVYEALDRDQHRNVALKTLLRVDPDSIVLFKQEFRALTDVHHRNLVHLYELVQAESGGPLFFTMELITGTDFLDYVHGGRAVRNGRGPSSSSSKSGTDATATRQIRPRAERPTSFPSPLPPALGDVPTLVDPERLRPALRQLVQGLRVLHAAGKLHRDIKPSNVLVTSGGRVVLVDFGIALELSRASEGRDQGIVGTPTYISPEQAASELPTPASDWYAVGVMLYEALAGRRPFEGSSIDILVQKMDIDPPPPSTWARGIPRDLESLCIALLQRKPAYRPDSADILRRLGAVPNARPEARSLRPAEAGPQSIVGREQQLQALRDAFDCVAAGQPVTLRVGGGAGMGKSTLVDRFLNDLAGSGEVEPLCGRAYERESVPYKAVDSLVDSLARLLTRVEEVDGPMVVPNHAWALIRLFPVLKRVPSLATLAEEPVDDANRVRHEAFGALREILRALARRRPLVLYIDDVQWGDLDSVALLHEVMRPPHAPTVLLVVTYRDEEAATSPFLLEMNERWSTAAEVRDVMVGPLQVEDARRLALERIGASDEYAQRTARAVARESKGSPFLIEELLRSNRTQSAAADQTLSVLALGQMVGERLERLPEAARRLAEVVAVGGRPLALSVLADACGEDQSIDEHVDLLRAERLVRTGFRDGREVIEPSHDRIRETIVEQLPGDLLRAYHGGLARALEAASSADLEAVAVHLLGSGQTERGAHFAERAAEQAGVKLAFAQAARLYRLALETLPRSSDQARPVRVQFAAALEQAGQAAEAARVYLAAAEGAPALERIDLQRAAAQQLLFAGRTEEGSELLRRVLAAVDMTAPRTPLGAVLSLLFHRLMLRLRGLEFKERTPEEVSLENRIRVEALYTVAIGFSVVDVVLGACMQARFLRLALDVGHRMHVLQATSIQITHLASQGGRIGKAEKAAQAIAERLSRTIENRDAEPTYQICLGLSFFHRGQWREAREAFYGRAALRANAAFSHGRLFGVYCLFYLGRLREQGRRGARLLADCERRGDMYTAVNLLAAPMVDIALAADKPEAAREHIRRALGSWTQNGFHIQHWKAMVWGAQIELYVGDGPAAYARLERDRRTYRRSLLDHSQFVREFTRYFRGCAAIASAIDAPAIRRARLKEARAAVRRLEREAMTWTAPLASLLRAALANAEGDSALAMTALRAAAEQAEAADMSLHAAAARYQLGCILGREEGDALRRQAESAMTAEGVRAPMRVAGMLAPGRWNAVPRAT
jgi:eukaryotic-like serine/threonine-protein kinase